MKTKIVCFLYLILIILSLSIFYSCNTVERDWGKACQENSIEAYENFINKHAKSEYFDEASKRLENLEWERDANENRIEPFSEFIKKYPNSAHVADAKANIEELEWKNAKQQNTIKVYSEFIANYPQSIYYNEALGKIELLEWNYAHESNMISAYENFIKNYPDGIYTNDAKQKLVESEWNNAVNANTINGFESFIKKNPISKYTHAASDRITDLKILDLKCKWENDFLDKDIYLPRSQINAVIHDIFSHSIAYSYREIENGIIDAYGVGDKDGKWSLKGNGGLVRVKQVYLDDHVIIGFKVDDGNKKASLFFHQLLAEKLANKK
jgi:outer membrane protein assembly factor BamD (BamD/ComL family)